jgi:hypothetical protein
MGSRQSTSFSEEARRALEGEGAAPPGEGDGFVGPLQEALAAIDQATLDAGEAGTARYGASTAGPVRKYRGMPAPRPAKGK